MARVKRGVTKNKRRSYLLEATKGYRFDRSKKKRAATEAVLHAHSHAFAHRRDKKNDFRRLWITRINAVLKEKGLKYSQFIKQLSDKEIVVDRKIMATLAKDRPEAFDRFIAEAAK